MLPDTTGRIGLIQVLDRQMNASQVQSDASRYDAVWGDLSYSKNWDAGHPGMIVSRYFLYTEDDNLVSGHDLTWWQTNHPDWILYACTNDGSPTHDLAYNNGEGFPDVPLDFSNPAVIDYQMNQLMIPYMRANGYNALAADNVNLQNILAGPNPTLGEAHPTSPPSEYGCGVYQNGQFVEKFGGPYGAQDPQYIAATINWLKTAHADLAAAGMKLIVNHSVLTGLNDPNEQAVLANTDGMMLERGFSNYGRYGTFDQELAYMTASQSRGVAFFVDDYFNDGATGSLSAQQKDYGIATYLLGNDGGADLFMSPSTGDIEFYYPEYQTRIGSPCASYTTSGTVYSRRFAGGIAVANSSGSSAGSVTLPSGSYTDLEGRPVSNPLTVAPNDGYVLLGGSGC